MFIGFVELDSQISSLLQVRNTSTGTPVAADAAPSFRIYGDDSGLNAVGTLPLKDTGAVTDASNASPIVITSAGHGLQNGMKLTVSGVGGNTAANGTWIVANVSADTFELVGSTGSGAWTSSGTWGVTGLYAFDYIPTSGAGFDAGNTYCALFNWTVSGVPQAEAFSFSVL